MHEKLRIVKRKDRLLYGLLLFGALFYASIVHAQTETPMLFPGCGIYPTPVIDDPYRKEQNGLNIDTILDQSGTEYECPDPYAGYAYTIQQLEERIPEEQKKQVVLIMMDSGIPATHEDLCQGQVNTELSATFLDSIHDTSSPLVDSVGHGSLTVASAVACSANEKGIASYGRDISVASVKLLFPCAFGACNNHSDFWAALQWVKKAAEADPDRILVVNMSFASSAFVQKEADMIAAMPRNVHFFAGAGNTSSSTPSDSPFYPASYPGVVGVGAVSDEKSNELCGFSHYQVNDTFLTATGCFDVWGFENSQDAFPYTDGKSGTSLASPQLAGLVSKFLQLGFSYEQIMSTLHETALPVTTSTQGSVIPQLQRISPLHAVQSLARQAGFDDLALPPTPTPISTEPPPTPTATPTPDPAPAQYLPYIVSDGI